MPSTYPEQQVLELLTVWLTEERPKVGITQVVGQTHARVELPVHLQIFTPTHTFFERFLLEQVTCCNNVWQVCLERREDMWWGGGWERCCSECHGEENKPSTTDGLLIRRRQRQTTLCGSDYNGGEVWCVVS